jgi:hypothetical protein
MVILEKGRKGDPVGTVKKMGKYWYRKAQNGKWMYEGQGAKAGQKKFTRKTVTRNDTVKKEIEWVIGTAPSTEYVKQEMMKEAKERFSGGLTDDVKSFLGEYDLKSFGDIMKMTETMKASDIQKMTDRIAMKMARYGYADKEKKELRGVSQFISDACSVNLLSDPNFDGKLTYQYMRQQPEGMRFSFTSNVGELPDMLITYDKMDEAIDTYVSTDSMRKYEKRRIKKSPDYKAWQIEHDPKLTEALDMLKKATGQVIDVGGSSRKSVQLKASYIKNLAKIFETLKAGMDLTKFTPKDGAPLKIRLTGSSKKAAGFYQEGNKSINIAPSKPGTISHEVGHYFWYRGGQELQQEFMKWAHDSGLYDRVDVGVGKKDPDPAVLKNHVNHLYNSSMKHLLKIATEYENQHPGRGLSDTARRGFQTLSNMLRLKTLEDRKSLGSWGRDPITMLFNLKDGDAKSMVVAAQAKGDFDGEDPDSLTMGLIALRNDLKSSDGQFKYTMMHGFSSLVGEGVRGTARSFHAKSASYFKEPTEMFARTFRAYVAMKDGQKVYETTEAERKAVPNAEKNPHGWGFPEVDPTEAMLKHNNNELQKILKKHLGEKAVKSMMLAIKVLDKSVAAEAMKEEGSYKEGDTIEGFDHAQMAAGIIVEMEHTQDEEVAEQIVLDHLMEDPDYYKKLATIEKSEDDEDDDDEEMSERDKEFEKERRNDEARADNDEAKVQKSRLVIKARKMAIGTVSHGRKKVAEGKWIDIPEGKRETDQYKWLMSQENSERKLISLVAKTLIGVHGYDRDEAMDQALILITGTKEEKNTELNQDTVEAYRLIRFEKAKPYPDGTVRKHGGRSMVKKDGGWVPATEGQPAVDKEKEDKARKGKPNKQGKGKDSSRKIPGDKKMFTCLNKVGTGKAPCLDDLKGEDKKTYNGLTKNGLITWTHLGKEEYVAELTENGRRALNDATAMQAKQKRKKGKKK